MSDTSGASGFTQVTRPKAFPIPVDEEFSEQLGLNDQDDGPFDPSNPVELPHGPELAPQGYHRRIIRITAEHSPNVRYAREQIAAGLEPTNEIIVPGVLSWAEYCKRRSLWDPVRQTIGLDAQFYTGSEYLLYPPLWLNQAEEWARYYAVERRIAISLGVDTAEGGDDTCFTAVAARGIVDQLSFKTPDTSVIPGRVIAYAKKWNIPPRMWVFDRGGGGKQHADYLRRMGYKVRTVGFGDPVKQRIKSGGVTVQERRSTDEERYAYVNVRGQMYWLLRLLLDSQENPGGWGIGARWVELRRQMSLVPLLYDHEGRLKVPHKSKRGRESSEPTLKEILGCSPDELDSTVLAVYGMLKPERNRLVGAF